MTADEQRDADVKAARAALEAASADWADHAFSRKVRTVLAALDRAERQLAEYHGMMPRRVIVTEEEYAALRERAEKAEREKDMAQQGHINRIANLVADCNALRERAEKAERNAYDLAHYTYFAEEERDSWEAKAQLAAGERDALAKQVGELKSAIGDYIRAWNNLDVPGDEGDEALVRLGQLSDYDEPIPGYLENIRKPTRATLERQVELLRAALIRARDSANDIDAALAAFKEGL
jgi:hypothetical protein